MHAGRTTAVHVAALVAVGLLLGSVVRPASLRLGLSPPRPGWLVAVLLLALAALVAAVAWSTWQSLHQRKQRMTSQHAVTLLAMAKACSIVGALSVGAYGGFALSFVRDWDTMFGQDRVLQGGLASASGLLLLVAALLLERTLHVPQPDDEDDDAPPGAATAA
ncbi:DUF3180 family protein [Aeromicrobium sp. Leaf291]|uniref:DUF3180 family protein n=1 Tax=Aeromicrobium sp. Leaf291 TaxID=1736325 RepID=UPI0006F1F5EE|nr:DUF3180 family protein [Aeromicrobium sp. Leaf291]KQP84335.1 hypothetical protein ASF35_05315 [Aeromicrobium sp. Leaf291]